MKVLEGVGRHGEIVKYLGKGFKAGVKGKRQKHRIRGFQVSRGKPQKGNGWMLYAHKKGPGMDAEALES